VLRDRLLQHVFDAITVGIQYIFIDRDCNEIILCLSAATCCPVHASPVRGIVFAVVGYRGNNGFQVWRCGACYFNLRTPT